jgi:hypothetical protein
MPCECGAHKRHVLQSALDVAVPYVRTKAQTPDPSITTSATAYSKFQRELRKWVGSILRDAVADVNVSTYATSEQFVAEIDRAVRFRSSQMPTYLRQYLQMQTTAGYTMGQAALPQIMRPMELVSANQVQQVLNEQMLRLSNQGALTARGTLKELLGDSLATGASPKEMADRVQEWAKQRGDQDRSVRWRAERIARTEASRGLNSGQVTAWKDMGVTRMSWAVAPRSCEFCRAMKKGSHSIDQPFLTVGSTLKGADGGVMSMDYADVRTPPLHPNCRCTLLPIVSNR